MQRGRSHDLFFLIALAAIVFPAAGLWLTAFGFVVFGLPHGGFDFALLPKPAIPRFLAVYVSLIVCFCLIASLWPICAFAMFLLLSAHHFGSELSSRIRSHSLAISVGLLLFAVVALGHLNLVRDSVAFVLHPRANAWPALGTVRAPSISIFCVGAVLLTKFFSSVRKRPTGFEVAGLLYVLWALPPLIGFFLFFAYWHALDSFLEQRDQLGLTFSGAIRASAVLAALAAGFIGLGSVVTPGLMLTLAGAISVSHILTRPLVNQAGVAYPSARERAAAIQ